jgi:DNA-binding response OmpR family regulator
LTKPFGAGELLARLRARHEGTQFANNMVVKMVDNVVFGTDLSGRPDAPVNFTSY